MVAIVQKITKDSKNFQWGVYHHCGDGITSWYGFTQTIIEKAKPFDSFQV